MSERDSGVVDPHGGLLLDPPNELRFRGPFDDYVTVSLSIKNPTDKKVAFKIKTTAPKRYCVKPNSGVLDSNQSMKVNVLLQPFNYDPNEKNKHKFMVQYMYLDDAEARLNVNDILNMWKDVPANRLLDLKLRCIFEYTESDQQQQQQRPNAQQQTPQLQQQQSNDSLVSSTTTTSSQPPKVEQRNVAANVNNSSPVNTRKSAAAAQAAAAAQSSSAASSATAAGDDTMRANKSDYVDASRMDNTSMLRNNKTSYTSASSLMDASNRQEKSDNASNELKSIKKENEMLKSEIEKLKINETRLSKLALQNAHGAHAAGGQDLLGNKLILVIVVLIAIIVYLLLFK